MNKTISTGIFAGLLILFSFGHHVSGLKKDQGLVVKPLRQKIIQDPGSTTGGVLTLTNDSNEPLTVELTSENFGVINESYDYSFKQDDSSKWIRFVDSLIQLEPREKRKVSYSLAIPATATPGGYDIALMSTIQSGSVDDTTTEYHRIASLLYLDVNGQAERKGSLLSFDIPWLTTNNDIGYTLKVANQGNTHLEFDVRVDSQLIFGGSHNQTAVKAFTLPRSVRGISDMTKISSMPGIYNISASYSPPQGQKQVITKRILYVPWVFTYSMLTLVGIILFAGFERWKIFKAKNTKEDH